MCTFSSDTINGVDNALTTLLTFADMEMPAEVGNIAPSHRHESGSIISALVRRPVNQEAAA